MTLEIPLHDMHCHLDFMANAREVAAQACERGMLLFCNTVNPAGWESAREAFADFGNVFVGFGMHPWWVSGDEGAFDAQATCGRLGTESQRAGHRRLIERAAEAHKQDLAAQQARRQGVVEQLTRCNPAILGEVGLDFGWKHVSSGDEQVKMLEAVAGWAAQSGGKLLSLHSVRAARETLDVLEQTGALASCTCVFHWFTGPSDQLKRAIDAGCYFSCGKRMVATGKGREYVKAIPVSRLLLETDAPPERGVEFSADALTADLEQVAEVIQALKGANALAAVAETSELLLHGAAA